MSYPAFPLVEISGAPYNRGRQYGSQAASRIRRSIRHYREQLHELGLGRGALRELIGDYLSQIESFDESYVEEMRGIATGAEMHFDDIVLVNARTEIVQLAKMRGHIPLMAPDDPDGCTGLVTLPEANAHGKLLHCLNWDWKAVCAETAMVLRIHRDEGPDVLTFTEAGSLARAGFNSEGITVTANYLESDRDHQNVGIPLTFIRRKMLESESLALAMRTAICTPTSSSNNLLISHRQGFAIDLECAPDETFPLYPANGILVHANHWTSPVALSKLRDTGIVNTPESLYRDWRVCEALKPHVGSLTPAHLKEALFDDFGSPWSVCRPPRASLFGDLSATVAMLIVEPSAQSMEIAPMPALQREFTKYTLA